MNAHKNTMAMHAVGYAKRGLYVFPAPLGKKQGILSAEKSNGNRWGCSSDPNLVQRYFEKYRDANIGIACGPESGVFVVDVDTPEGHDKDGIASLQQLEAEHGALPDTMMEKSPSGSLHYYFKYPKNVTIKNSTSGVGVGIDIKGSGGMVIAAPSRVPGKGIYHLLNDLDPVDAPQWLIDAILFAQNAGDAGDEDHEAGDEPMQSSMIRRNTPLPRRLFRSRNLCRAGRSAVVSSMPSTGIGRSRANICTPISAVFNRHRATT